MLVFNYVWSRASLSATNQHLWFKLSFKKYGDTKGVQSLFLFFVMLIDQRVLKDLSSIV